MGKYITFKAQARDEKFDNWERMSLNHTGAFTFILGEYYDSSDKPIPQKGYRLREYYHIEQFADARFPKVSTHSRVGDWEVTRVDRYDSRDSEGEFSVVAICYCRYAPIESPLEPLPPMQVPENINAIA